MTSADGYPTAAGVEAAIKAAAQSAAAEDSALSVAERIRLESFRRFLSRVFSDGAESEWILKGGSGILARIPTARATRDVDLFCSGYPLDTALADLRRLAHVDLHDHFRFEYVGHRQSIGGDAQPYTDGYQVSFAVFIGANARGTLNVDLASGAGLTAEVISIEPASALSLPRLLSYPFRLYPVVDQIADKVCATLADYVGRPSTREKDLVDLVVFATTHDIDGDALSAALDSEIRRRRLPHPDRFTVPLDWGRGYSRLAARVPACGRYRSVADASELVAGLIDPALSGASCGCIWRHQFVDWRDAIAL